jgi:hypothetical protein
MNPPLGSAVQQSATQNQTDHSFYASRQTQLFSDNHPDQTPIRQSNYNVPMHQTPSYQSMKSDPQQQPQVPKVTQMSLQQQQQQPMLQRTNSNPLVQTPKTSGAFEVIRHWGEDVITVSLSYE